MSIVNSLSAVTYIPAIPISPCPSNTAFVTASPDLQDVKNNHGFTFHYLAVTHYLSLTHEFPHPSPKSFGSFISIEKLFFCPSKFSMRYSIPSQMVCLFPKLSVVTL